MFIIYGFPNGQSYSPTPWLILNTQSLRCPSCTAKHFRRRSHLRVSNLLPFLRLQSPRRFEEVGGDFQRSGHESRILENISWSHLVLLGSNGTEVRWSVYLHKLKALAAKSRPWLPKLFLACFLFKWAIPGFGVYGLIFLIYPVKLMQLTNFYNVCWFGIGKRGKSPYFSHNIIKKTAGVSTTAQITLWLNVTTFPGGLAA